MVGLRAIDRRVSFLESRRKRKSAKVLTCNQCFGDPS